MFNYYNVYKDGQELYACHRQIDIILLLSGFASRCIQLGYIVVHKRSRYMRHTETEANCEAERIKRFVTTCGETIVGGKVFANRDIFCDFAVRISVRL